MAGHLPVPSTRVALIAVVLRRCSASALFAARQHEPTPKEAPTGPRNLAETHRRVRRRGHRHADPRQAWVSKLDAVLAQPLHLHLPVQHPRRDPADSARCPPPLAWRSRSRCRCWSGCYLHRRRASSTRVPSLLRPPACGLPGFPLPLKPLVGGNRVRLDHHRHAVQPHRPAHGEHARRPHSARHLRTVDRSAG